MGKREGEFISLDEVIDEIGRDATRFFYLIAATRHAAGIRP